MFYTLMYRRIYLQIIFVNLILASFIACQKDSSTPTPTPTINYKDSAILIARDAYLWYNQIPSTFNANSYSTLNDIMVAIRQYSMESGYTKPVDRWSFSIKKTDYNNVASGNAVGSLGLYLKYVAASDIRVQLVDGGSPAALANIKRGWKITAVNNQSDLYYSQTTINFLTSAISGGNAVTITFEYKDDNNVTKTVTHTLTPSSYKINPVGTSKIFTLSNNKKVGYLPYHSFIGDTTAMKTNLATILNNFASNNIDDIILDLRYNGGGYVLMADYLLNYLVNSSNNKKIAYTYKFNDKYTNENISIFFNKQGNLNLSRVFVLTTRNSASASELVINGLKGVGSVITIGDTSHGKPVGYGPIPVNDEYVFPVLFKTVNNKGESNYFLGFTPDKLCKDDITKDFGDASESMLACALNYIDPNQPNGQPLNSGRIGDLQNINLEINDNRIHINGLIAPSSLNKLMRMK